MLDISNSFSTLVLCGLDTRVSLYIWYKISFDYDTEVSFDYDTEISFDYDTEVPFDKYYCDDADLNRCYPVFYLPIFPYKLRTVLHELLRTNKHKHTQNQPQQEYKFLYLTN